jgi:hypothetical protein
MRAGLAAEDVDVDMDVEVDGVLAVIGDGVNDGG